MDNRRLYTKKFIVFMTLICVFIFFSCATTEPFKTTQPEEGPIKNMILFIGDGMGFEHVNAASIYLSGTTGSLSFEGFPFKGSINTFSADNKVTDSAAAATAIATGVKVNNGVISVQLPGDGSPLSTILELYKDMHKSVGLVTTTTITHATPAAFGAHEISRNNFSNIAEDYLSASRPEVLFGGAAYITSSMATEAGYVVIDDNASLVSLDTDSVVKISGQFGNDHLPYEFDGLGTLPHLSSMVLVALNILDNDEDGFFLMVEGGRIDHASHINDAQRTVFETVEFSKAVEVAYSWADSKDDTLIIVTADHETGGLSLGQNNGINNIPEMFWSTTGHTNSKVPIYAWGKNASGLGFVQDNVDVFTLMSNQ